MTDYHNEKKNILKPFEKIEKKNCEKISWIQNLRKTFDEFVKSLCIRTMALPVGRGAISFQTANPLPTEPITIPRLCLSGKAPPRGNLLM